MKYVSTRDKEQKEYSFKDVLLEGLAPDGGLFVPLNYPSITNDDLKSLANKPYTEVAQWVFGLFVGNEIAHKEQKELVAQAYSQKAFFGTKNGNITPVTPLNDRIYIQELSHGPTAAFKDMALRLLAQYMNSVLHDRGKRLTILGATSGDTGSSAESALKGLENVKLIMLSPRVGMSNFQKAQMAELNGSNILNISIDGRFDDCQSMVKSIKQDPEFADLGAVNSINWARVAAQIAYYVYGYLQVTGETSMNNVDFVVPTGNFGNILACFIAKHMGVPIRKVVAATNENSVVDTLIQTGVYRRPKVAVVTSSPSMDITVASNYERLLTFLLPNNPQAVQQYMSEFATKGTVELAEFSVSNNALKKLGFDSSVSTHTDRVDTIRWAHSIGRLIDPHTADGITAARKLRAQTPTDTTPIICMETALPVKFPDIIQEAIGHIPEAPERFKKLSMSSAAAIEFRTIAAGDIFTLKKIIRDFR